MIFVEFKTCFGFSKKFEHNFRTLILTTKCMYTLKKQKPQFSASTTRTPTLRKYGLYLEKRVNYYIKRYRCPARRWPRLRQFTHSYTSARMDAWMVGSKLYGTPDCHRYCCICGYIGGMRCSIPQTFGWFTRRTKGCLL